MASDLQIQGEVVVNSEQAERAFDRVGGAADGMANEVAASAGKAGQAVDKIGDGAGASAEKFTRAESRISASIKRATNELELMGKTASQRLEFNISDKGLDPRKFEPMLQRLREVEAQAQAAQRAASGSLDKMGVSAAQTAAALRQLPAQFSDIVISLQGGQAPLTVFLQQGSQIKDAFGGAGAAARALSGYVAGLVSPLTIAAAAGAALAVAYHQGSQEADGYRSALISTGNAAGTNAAQLKAYAQEISAVVGTQGNAAESLTALAATGKVGAESLRDAAKAAVQYERATGQAVGKTAEQFASLRDEPLSAVLKLNDSMNFLTDSTYRQIKSLEDQGKTAEAANVAQRAFADTLSGRAGEMERNLGTVERGWLAVKDAAKSAWDAILNVGRASTSVDQLAEVRRQIAQRENQIANAGFVTNEGGAAFGRPSLANTERLRAELSALQAQAAALEGVAYQTRVAADEERKRGEAVKATAAFDKAGEKFLSDKAKMERELSAARVQGVEAGKSQAEIEQRLAQIRDSYAKKGGSADANRELERQAKLFAELSGLSGTFAQDWQSLNNAFAAGRLSVKQLTEEQAKLLEKQPFAVAHAKEQAEATKQWVKAYEDAAKAEAKVLEQRQKSAETAEQQVQKLRDEEQAAGIAAAKNISLAQALEEVALARMREQEEKLRSQGADGATLLALQREIEAREKIVSLIAVKDARSAADSAAKDAKREWERTAESIERSLTDALLRGFESGKDFAKNLRDTIANMFKTLVLRPIISAVISPVAQAATSVVNSAIGGIGSSILGNMGVSALGGAGFFSGITTAVAAGFKGATLGAGMMGPTTAGAGGAMGFGNMLASIPGWGWALAGIAALGLMFSKKSTPHSGAGAIYSDTLGLQTGADIYNKPTFGMGIADEYNAETSKAVGGIAKGLAEALDGVAKTFGKTAGFEIATAFADDSSKDGAWGQLRISQGGKDLLNWAANPKRDGIPKEFADGQAGYAEYLATIAQDARQVLLDMDLPSWADTMLNSIGELSNMDQLSAVVQQIAEVQTMFVHLGDTLVGFAGMTDKAFEALLKASGGAQALAANADAFYQGFYSDSERKDIAKRQLSEKLKGLGVDISLDDPEAKAKYRKLVEEQLAKANGEEAARSALKGSIAGALTGGGIDGLRGMDVGSIVRGVLGDAKDLTQADIDKLTSGIASLDTAGMSLDGLKDSVGKLLEPIVGTGKGAADTAAALLGLSGEFAGLTASADDLAEAEKKRAQEQIDARDKAMRLLERSIAKEREALQSRIDVARETANTMGGLFDLLHQNVRSLYGEVDSTRTMLVAQGNDFINQALQAARTTGYLPEQSQLADAISAARGGIDQGAYTSQFAADRDRLVLAGKLLELGEITGEQLTTAELQLKAANDQIDYLDALEKRADDLVNGTTALTESVESYFEKLLALLAPKEEKPTGGSSGGKFAIGGSATGRGSSAGGGSGRVDVSSDEKALAYIRSVYNGQESGLVDAIAAIRANTGLGQGDIARITGVNPDDLATLLGKYGIGYFDVGTNFVPADMPAIVHKGERIIPAADNRALMQMMQGGSGSSNDALVKEIRGLREEVAQLRQAAVTTAANTAGLPTMVTQFDDVTEGGNAMRSGAAVLEL